MLIIIPTIYGYLREKEYHIGVTGYNQWCGQEEASRGNLAPPPPPP